MADLPADETERMSAARRALKLKLERDLAPLGRTRDILACGPAFAEFARRGKYGPKWTSCDQAPWLRWLQDA